MVVDMYVSTSRLTFFTVAAAWDMSILPTRVEPVKPILRTTSDFISSSAASNKSVEKKLL